jgi:hypothetical protein
VIQLNQIHVLSDSFVLADDVAVLLQFADQGINMLLGEWQLALEITKARAS